MCLNVLTDSTSTTPRGFETLTTLCARRGCTELGRLDGVSALSTPAATNQLSLRNSPTELEQTGHLHATNMATIKALDGACEEQKTNALLFIAWFFAGLSVITVGLRLFARIHLYKGLGWDDYSMIGALVSLQPPPLSSTILITPSGHRISRSGSGNSNGSVRPRETHRMPNTRPNDGIREMEDHIGNHRRNFPRPRQGLGVSVYLEDASALLEEISPPHSSYPGLLRHRPLSDAHLPLRFSVHTGPKVLGPDYSRSVLRASCIYTRCNCGNRYGSFRHAIGCAASKLTTRCNSFHLSLRCRLRFASDNLHTLFQASDGMADEVVDLPSGRTGSPVSAGTASRNSGLITLALPFAPLESL